MAELFHIGISNQNLIETALIGIPIRCPRWQRPILIEDNGMLQVRQRQLPLRSQSQIRHRWERNQSQIRQEPSKFRKHRISSILSIKEMHDFQFFLTEPWPIRLLMISAIVTLMTLQRLCTPNWGTVIMWVLFFQWVQRFDSFWKKMILLPTLPTPTAKLNITGSYHHRLKK